MEPHRQLPDGFEEYEPPLDKDAFSYFERALAFTRKFYLKEMNQISSVKFEDVSPDHFFWEYVFVVHATGFSAKVVGNFIKRLMHEYGDWIVLATENQEQVVERVRNIINNPQKIIAVWKMAKHMFDGIHEKTWDKYKFEYLSSPDLLKKLPYIGKITCFHLARNIGLLENVKPDLHLVRLAKHWGYKDCVLMCEEFQKSHETLHGEKIPLGIIDLCLWYACSTFGSISVRKEGDR